MLQPVGQRGVVFNVDNAEKPVTEEHPAVKRRRIESKSNVIAFALVDPKANYDGQSAEVSKLGTITTDVRNIASRSEHLVAGATVTNCEDSLGHATVAVSGPAWITNNSDKELFALDRVVARAAVLPPKKGSRSLRDDIMGGPTALIHGHIARDQPSVDDYDKVYPIGIVLSTAKKSDRADVLLYRPSPHILWEMEPEIAEAEARDVSALVDAIIDDNADLRGFVDKFDKAMGSMDKEDAAALRDFIKKRCNPVIDQISEAARLHDWAVEMLRKKRYTSRDMTEIHVKTGEAMAYARRSAAEFDDLRPELEHMCLHIGVATKEMHSKSRHEAPKPPLTKTVHEREGGDSPIPTKRRRVGTGGDTDDDDDEPSESAHEKEKKEAHTAPAAVATGDITSVWRKVGELIAKASAAMPVSAAETLLSPASPVTGDAGDTAPPGDPPAVSVPEPERSEPAATAATPAPPSSAGEATGDAGNPASSGEPPTSAPSEPEPAPIMPASVPKPAAAVTATTPLPPPASAPPNLRPLQAPKDHSVRVGKARDLLKQAGDMKDAISAKAASISRSAESCEDDALSQIDQAKKAAEHAESVCGGLLRGGTQQFRAAAMRRINAIRECITSIDKKAASVRRDGGNLRDYVGKVAEYDIAVANLLLRMRDAMTGIDGDPGANAAVRSIYIGYACTAIEDAHREIDGYSRRIDWVDALVQRSIESIKECTGELRVLLNTINDNAAKIDKLQSERWRELAREMKTGTEGLRKIVDAAKASVSADAGRVAGMAASCDADALSAIDGARKIAEDAESVYLGLHSVGDSHGHATRHIDSLSATVKRIDALASVVQRDSELLRKCAEGATEFEKIVTDLLTRVTEMDAALAVPAPSDGGVLDPATTAKRVSTLTDDAHREMGRCNLGMRHIVEQARGYSDAIGTCTVELRELLRIVEDKASFINNLQRIQQAKLAPQAKGAGVSAAPVAAVAEPSMSPAVPAAEPAASTAEPAPLAPEPEPEPQPVAVSPLVPAPSARATPSTSPPLASADSAQDAPPPAAPAPTREPSPAAQSLSPVQQDAPPASVPVAMPPAEPAAEPASSPGSPRPVPTADETRPASQGATALPAVTPAVPGQPSAPAPAVQPSLLKRMPTLGKLANLASSLSTVIIGTPKPAADDAYRDVFNKIILLLLRLSSADIGGNVVIPISAIVGALYSREDTQALSLEICLRDLVLVCSGIHVSTEGEPQASVVYVARAILSLKNVGGPFLKNILELISTGGSTETYLTLDESFAGAVANAPGEKWGVAALSDENVSKARKEANDRRTSAAEPKVVAGGVAAPTARPATAVAGVVAAAEAATPVAATTARPVRPISLVNTISAVAPGVPVAGGLTPLAAQTGSPVESIDDSELLNHLGQIILYSWLYSGSLDEPRLSALADAIVTMDVSAISRVSLAVLGDISWLTPALVPQSLRKIVKSVSDFVAVVEDAPIRRDYVKAILVRPAKAHTVFFEGLDSVSSNARAIATLGNAAELMDTVRIAMIDLNKSVTTPGSELQLAVSGQLHRDATQPADGGKKKKKKKK